jgi:hypothetical protein
MRKAASIAAVIASRNPTLVFAVLIYAQMAASISASLAIVMTHLSQHIRDDGLPLNVLVENPSPA